MKNQVNLSSVVWALVFAIIFPISVFILSKYSISAPLALLIIGINALLFGIYTLKLIRSISILDEVQIRIQLEAVSIAFVLSLLLIMTLGLVETTKVFAFDGLSFLYIFPIFFLFYIIGLIFSNSKYK
ncbi:hypothetical protein GCM10011514_16320 [Emticicia aquatilis]|uniref:Uncharacterized protein n=1 Tax=Emticicia aquatilis TaxID=1537369 RepID=A0A917DP18_9BACT|nr:hypothetical protein [Emticicia aquatilis]GGD52915.1 hypothetical protein GCM10011514_16320 [Emticicia aquatilis]